MIIVYGKYLKYGKKYELFLYYKIIFFYFLYLSIVYANDYNCTMTTLNSFTFTQTLSKVENNYIAVDFDEEPFDIIHEDENVLLLSTINLIDDEGYGDISSWSINKENLKALSFYVGSDQNNYQPADAFAVGECKSQ